MYHVWKWAHLNTRMVFAPDEGGAGPASTPTPSPSGDGGGGTSVAPSPSDGGGTGAPSTSAPPSPDSGGAPPTDDANPWESLGATFGGEDTIEIPAPTAPPVAPAVTPAPAPPAPTPVVAPATPAPTAQPPQAPASPTSPSPQAAPPLSADDPVGVANAMEASRDAVIAHLASTKFQLSEAEIAEFESDAATAIPKLAAKIQHDTLTTMYRFLAQSVPGMIQRHTKVTTANNDAEKQFFDAHKALGLKMDDPKHRTAATRIATIYRQANPGIPLNQLIAEVGPMVATALQLQGTAAPTTPALPNGAPKPVGFRPAVGGGGPSSPAPAPVDEWSQLGQNFEE